MNWGVGTAPQYLKGNQQDSNQPVYPAPVSTRHLQLRFSIVGGVEWCELGPQCLQPNGTQGLKLLKQPLLGTRDWLSKGLKRPLSAVLQRVETSCLNKTWLKPLFGLFRHQVKDRVGPKPPLPPKEPLRSGGSSCTRFPGLGTSHLVFPQGFLQFHFRIQKRQFPWTKL